MVIQNTNRILLFTLIASLFLLDIKNVSALSYLELLEYSISSNGKVLGASTNGLVGYWNFDENTGTSATDSSGYGNAGQLQNGASWTTGKLGGAVAFNGTDSKVLVGNPSVVNFGAGQDFTISLWIKGSDTTQAQKIISKRSSTSDGYQLRFNNSSSLIWRVDEPVTITDTVAPSHPLSGTWRNVVTGRNGSQHFVYIDGVLVKTSTDSTSDSLQNVENLTIGNDQGSAEAFNGSIDEVRIYNRGLTSQEILDIYNDNGVVSPPADTTAPTVPTGLLATAQSSSQINLSWNASTDTVGVTGYKIFRGGLQVGTSASTTYNDTGLTASTQYSYTVSAYDVAGNNSVQSSSVSATTQAPAQASPVINSFTASPSSVASGQASTLSWNVTGATSLSINQSIGTVTGTSQNVSPTVTTTYILTATNAQGSVNSSVTVTVSTQPPVTGNVFYVAPNGTSSGNGSISNPWDVNALNTNKASVPPGSTVYLRGGRYVGNFGIGLNGTAVAPIIVRSYPGEWAVFDGYDPSVTLTSVVGTNGSNSVGITATVSDASKLKRGPGQSLDNEEIYITNIQGNTITFLRGWSASAIVSHPVGAVIQPHGGTVIVATGLNTWFMDFEVMSSDPVRQTSIAGSGPVDIHRSSGIDINGDGIKLINLVIHDVVNGIFTYDTAKDVEVNGVLTYSNGWWGPDRGHGHGMYVRNGSGTLHKYNDIISFDNYATGQKVFGYQAHGEHVYFDGFVGFNNEEGNFLIGVSTYPMKNIAVRNSYIYSPNNASGKRGGSGMRFGYGNTQNIDLVVENNYLAGRIDSLDIGPFQSAKVTGNTIWSSGNNIGSSMFKIFPGSGRTTADYNIDNNTYYDNDNGTVTYNFGYPAGPNTLGGGNYNYNLDWKRLTPFDVNSTYIRSTAGGVPNTDKHFVEPNAYELGRANIVVYNWSQSNSVLVNVSSSGLIVGDAYEIRDAQNYLGTPVVTGVYNGGNITIPMTFTAVYPKVGNLFFTPVHTSKEFGVFVIKKVGGSVITPPLSDTTAPTVPANLSVSVVSSSVVNLSWTPSTDAVGVTGYKIYRGGVQVGTSASTSFSDTGLTASTLYSYTISAYDAVGNNSSQSGSVSATTQAILPAISNLVGSLTTATTTRISWNTNSVTNGQVFYGLTTGYGSQSSLIDDLPKTTTHTINLSSLTPATTYNFKVVSVDALGNATSSPNFTFTTLSLPLPSAPTISSFTASPAAITQGGSTTLTWSVNGATNVSINQNIGVVTGTSLSVSPSSQTTFTLTATNSGGTSSAQLTVNVSTPVVVPTTTAPTIISLTASPSAITSGSQSALSWIVTGSPTPTISINQSIGTVSGTSQAISPSQSTTYTLTATNSAGVATAQVNVAVNQPVVTPPATTGGNGSSGGNSGSNTGSQQPTIVVYIPAVTTTNVGGRNALRLINSNGTYYLVENSQLKGITNPGMLASYGFTFAMAKTATPNDLTLPKTNLLTPGNGSLVKSKEDQTVYLISRGQRHAFISAKVFTNLGFKFNSVLLVTNPELQILPKASDLDNGVEAHKSGVDINRNGTIYWIGEDNSLHGYPSLDVYNSWHIPNDFSKVVLANTADNSLPVGALVEQRIVE